MRSSLVCEGKQSDSFENVAINEDPSGENRREFLSQKNNYSQLTNQNRRDTQGEFQVLCFVPEGVHSCKAADAAADGCCQQQGAFRDPPKLFLGHTLVPKHKGKSNGIDYKKVE